MLVLFLTIIKIFRAQSEAEAEASRARAAAVKEEEHVNTVRETERAERAKAVELLKARQAAERDAISVTMAAQAEKQAAEDRAEALTTEANAESEKAKIAAMGDAEAERLRADAAAVRYQVDAEGKRALNEAENLLSKEQIEMQIRMALIRYLPDIIRESVKPMEQIDGIKIIQVDGLNGGHGPSVAVNSMEFGENNQGSLADQVVNSALRYRAQGPLVDSLLSEIGLRSGDINGLTASLKNGADGTPSEGGEAAAS